MGGHSVLYRRPRGGRFSSSAQDNVINLDQYRVKAATRGLTLFYLNGNGAFRDEVLDLTQGRVVEIQNMETLSSALILYKPDCIIVESSMDWANPFALVTHLTANYEAPVLMLFEPMKAADADANIRRAYACGVTDTLFAPLCNRELMASLKILLRMSDKAFELGS